MTRACTTKRPPKIDQALRSLFKGYEVRALPERIRTVVEQLDAAPAKTR